MAAFNQTNATKVLLDANFEACELLAKLNDKVDPPVNQYFVNNASALFFTWTLKAGVIFGVSAGQGFVVKQLGGGKWGAPCFVKIAAAQAGAIVGVEKVESVLAATDSTPITELKEGHTPVLGSDLSFQVWPIIKEGCSAMDALRESWNLTNIVGISHCAGVVFDYSFKGGAISVDVKRNEEAYGAGVSAVDLLTGAVKGPHEFEPLYKRLEEIKATSPA